MRKPLAFTAVPLGLTFTLALVLAPAAPGSALAAAMAGAPGPVPEAEAPPPAGPEALPFEAAVFLGCDKLPAGNQAVRLALPREVDVQEVLAFLAPLSCSPVRLGAGIAAGTKVKLPGVRLVSAKEAFSIVDAAITDAGLSLEAEKAGPRQFQLIVKRPTAR